MFKSDSQRRAVFARMASSEKSNGGLLGGIRARINRYKLKRMHKQNYASLGNAVMQTSEFKNFAKDHPTAAGALEGAALRGRVEFGTKFLGKKHPQVIAGKAAYNYLYAQKQGPIQKQWPRRAPDFKRMYLVPSDYKK